MRNDRIDDWLDEVSGANWLWYLKRLSANDTLANDAHQAGPYISKALGKLLFPGFFEASSPSLNPKHRFSVVVDSHDDTEREVQAVWYNNRVVSAGTRNELRVTGWGGRSSALLAPESTGSLVVLAFDLTDGAVRGARVWVCRSPDEEDVLENRLGAVEPKQSLIFRPGSGLEITQEDGGPCRLRPDEIPPEWRAAFPAADEIVDYSVARSATLAGWTADQRLVARRNCEYQVFRSVEEQLVLPRVREGFTTVDDFMAFAGTVSNRRKSRSGRSLELHLRRIFTEEGIPFAHGAVSEGSKRPDFLFPSMYHYRNHGFADDKLRMLGAKTTCKDRWRQIINEADRIKQKHLFTLQEGVSENQHKEMADEGVQLVIPEEYRRHYPLSIRDKLVTLREFVQECRHLYRDVPSGQQTELPV